MFFEQASLVKSKIVSQLKKVLDPSTSPHSGSKSSFCFELLKYQEGGFTKAKHHLYLGKDPRGVDGYIYHFSNFRNLIFYLVSILYQT